MIFEKGIIEEGKKKTIEWNLKSDDKLNLSAKNFLIDDDDYYRGNVGLALYSS